MVDEYIFITCLIDQFSKSINYWKVDRYKSLKCLTCVKSSKSFFILKIWNLLEKMIDNASKTLQTNLEFKTRLNMIRTFYAHYVFSTYVGTPFVFGFLFQFWTNRYYFLLAYYSLKKTFSSNLFIFMFINYCSTIKVFKLFVIF